MSWIQEQVDQFHKDNEEMASLFGLMGSRDTDFSKGMNTDSLPRLADFPYRDCPNIDFGQLKDKSGFFDLPKQDICNHPDHRPPTHIYIPQGKGYRHVCPGCGKVTNLIPLQITF